MEHSNRRHPLLALVLLAALPACHKQSNDQLVADMPPSTPPPPALPSSAPEPQSWSPSGYLLMTKERLDELRKSKGTNHEWEMLQKNAEIGLVNPGPYESSPENLAVAYLVSGDARFGHGAFTREHVQEAIDVRGDSYLNFGNLMRGAAFVLNYCAPELSPDQKKELVDYLERWTHELWFDNKGSGWGLNDPGNNYFMSFLEGTAYAGYALKAANEPSGDKLIALLREKIERPGGVLTYLKTRAKGGDWQEGANYGQRARQRMFGAFAVVASMGGPNYFNENRFTAETIFYAIYQLQPGNKFMAPTGDLPRDTTMPESPYDRDYIQLATFYTNDAVARGYGAWFLTEVVPSYAMPLFNWREAYYKDVLFGTPGKPTPPTNLPLSYRSVGTDWIDARSGWDERATNVTILATPVIDQSHAHCDTGSFLIWKGGWQAVEGAMYSSSGLNWEPGAHNMIQVAGSERRPHKNRGLVLYSATTDYVFASIDATNLFVKRVAGTEETLLDEWTREIVYVRPDAVVTYDRVVPKSIGKDYSWRFHFPTTPVLDAGRYAAKNDAGGASLAIVSDGTPKIAPDTDIEDKLKSWRVEVGPNPNGRYAAVVVVANGGPPPLSASPVTGSGVEGVTWSNQVVVFSAAAHGAPASLPFTYTFKGTDPRTHTIVDVHEAVDVAVTRDQSTTTVRVGAGSQYRPDQGAVHFSK